MKRVHFASDLALAICVALIVAISFGVHAGVLVPGEGFWILGSIAAGLAGLFWFIIVVSGQRWSDWKVDIWHYQQKLHRASGQASPELPVLTRDSLLYVALIAEEFSEKLGHISTIGSRHYKQFANGAHTLALARYLDLVEDLHKLLDRSSRDLRTYVGAMPEVLTIELEEQEKRDLLDDNNDISVVNAGFAVATGLPAREGYEEVGVSNLSKRNPDTGIIDKDAGGKWIKGRDYVKPDLARVLQRQRDDLLDSDDLGW